MHSTHQWINQYVQLEALVKLFLHLVRHTEREIVSEGERGPPGSLPKLAWPCYRGGQSKGGWRKQHPNYLWLIMQWCSLGTGESAGPLRRSSTTEVNTASLKVPVKMSL